MLGLKVGDWVIVTGYPNTIMNGRVGKVLSGDSDGYILTEFTGGKLHLFPREIEPWVCKLGRW